MKKIAIIGAGPAGMAAAIAAAKKGALVSVFERNAVAGKKLLLTGNGRCNFSNMEMDERHFSFPKESFANDIIHSMSAEDVCAFFEEMGVLSIERKGGLYPFTGQSLTIQTALLRTMEKMGVRIIYDTCVGKIIKRGNQFLVPANEKELCFDAVILACGGKAAPKTGSDGYGYRLAREFGHTVSRIYPVLVQLISDAPDLKTINGVRCYANVTAYIDGRQAAFDYGEVQMTDYGLSGIPVFHLSRFLSKPVEEKKNCIVSVDFLPLIPKDSLDEYFHAAFERQRECVLVDFLSGYVHNKLADYVIKQSGLQRDFLLKEFPEEELLLLIHEMKNWKFPITGHKGYENAQVTKGGVLLSELDEKMQSKLIEGLYFAGEMVDVDADCGGYNLHWAWTSGKKAGEEAAK